MKKSSTDSAKYSSKTGNLLKVSPREYLVIGLFFAIGSILFALGSVDGYILGRYTEGYEFFVGSWFFTVAAFLQYWWNVAPYHKRARDFILRGIYAWALVIQLAGAVFFNISTYMALKYNLTVTSIYHQVWNPDVFGSICFLLANIIFFGVIKQELGRDNTKNWSWWNTIWNFLGSEAFVLSAFMALVLHRTGIHDKDLIINMVVFIGSLCFLMGALVLFRKQK